jgi:hypothetical protein
VRLSEKEKTLEFSDNWIDISRKGGRKKKFSENQYRALVKYVLSYWRDYSNSEINKWKAPEWLKEEHYRVNNKNNVYVTINNFGEIVIEFESNHTPIKINKSSLFYSMYDRYLYIYEKILFIAQSVSFSEIRIHTDLVDLLRINRIYWRDNPYEVQAYVYVSKRENLNFKENWKKGESYGKEK